MNRIRFGMICLCVMLPCHVGCGDKEVAGRPRLYPASGLITYQGKPVPGATVTFFPVEDVMPSASAKTNAEGRYILQTFEADDGVVAGTHKVSIMKWKIEAFQGNEDEGDSNYKMEPPPKTLIPQKYSTPTTSGLEAAVAESKSNQFDFELTD